MHYDIFNGDADGICSLLQLRLESPKQGQLISGVKRDINLLEHLVTSEQDSVTVLDISMAKNQDGLKRILDSGAQVFYADHHQDADLSAPNLTRHIHLGADSCTALIIDNYLKRAQHKWAIVGAYGDNLISVADKLCQKSAFTEQQTTLLKELGTLINYNGYGRSIDELHFSPTELYQTLLHYPCPFELGADLSSPYHKLKAGYQADLDSVANLSPYYSDQTVAAYVLEDTPASHRISGVFANQLANRAPNKAHLVFSQNLQGNYTASLRAPLTNKQGASEVCSQFPTGGGRAGAAGVNNLLVNQIDELLIATQTYYQR